MLAALELAGFIKPELIDVTGGEPALWNHIRELVALVRESATPLRVRTNLVALRRPEASDLPALFAREGVALLASLPETSSEGVAAQRGRTAFDQSIDVLRELTSLGYGADGGPVLDVAYNPPLGELSLPEAEVTGRFRAGIEEYGVRFNALHAITNVPVGRYRDRLRAGDELDAYVALLAAAFNPDVAGSIACREGLTIGWNGELADCDFNLGAGLGLLRGPRTLDEALAAARADGADARLGDLATRYVAFGPHCFACTAGPGSS